MADCSTIKEEVNGYVRHLIMSVPFDKRHPEPNKNYGVHGITLSCVLVKDKKAVQFVAYLPVYLPHIADELWHKEDRRYNHFKGMGADVGYHSPIPMFDGHKPMKNDCPYTEGKCYYDGSSLQAEEWYDRFLRFGLDLIWKNLEERWKDQFEAEPEKESE